MSELAGRPLSELAARVASHEPGPGAGPSPAWTCGLAAALVEMVAAVALRHDPDHAAGRRRRDRAVELRTEALALADVDVKAYTEVLAHRWRRVCGMSHGEGPGSACRHASATWTGERRRAAFAGDVRARSA